MASCQLRTSVSVSSHSLSRFCAASLHRNLEVWVFHADPNVYSKMARAVDDAEMEGGKHRRYSYHYMTKTFEATNGKQSTFYFMFQALVVLGRSILILITDLCCPFFTPCRRFQARDCIRRFYWLWNYCAVGPKWYRKGKFIFGISLTPTTYDWPSIFCACVKQTTFIRILAGLIPPDPGFDEIPKLNISYKPQKISPKFEGSVRDLLQMRIRDAYLHPQFVTDVTKPMMIDEIIDQQVITNTHLCSSIYR